MNEEMKNKIWNNIQNVIMKYELICGESIYQSSEIQENTADILYEILSPLLGELEKIDIEKIEEEDFDIDILLGISNKMSEKNGTISKKRVRQNMYGQSTAMWSKDSQVNMCIEEMAELTKALCKARRYKKPDNWLDQIYEEIADVTIMLEQMIHIYDGEEIVEWKIDSKMEKLSKAIQEWTDERTEKKWGRR